MTHFLFFLSFITFFFTTPIEAVRPGNRGNRKAFVTQAKPTLKHPAAQQLNIKPHPRKQSLRSSQKKKTHLQVRQFVNQSMTTGTMDANTQSYFPNLKKLALYIPQDKQIEDTPVNAEVVDYVDAEVLESFTSAEGEMVIDFTEYNQD